MQISGLVVAGRYYYLLEDDGGVVRREGQQREAVGGVCDGQFYLLFDNPARHSGIEYGVDVLGPLVKVVIYVYRHRWRTVESSG